jgi:hypothetical protein
MIRHGQSTMDAEGFLMFSMPQNRLNGPSFVCFDFILET